ncbi:MAG: DNA polymerase III subunit epsilon [Burkholderiales bacterium]
MRQIILDTETTGLSADSGDRIIEIGCIEMVSRRYTGRNLHHYLNPERKSHADAVRVHGLTDDFLADKPKFAAVADEFLAFVQGAELIIHNAAFDVGFLDAELKRLGHPPLRNHVTSVVDTLLMAREQYPGKANSLDALCKRLEVDNTNRTLHGALLDAGLLAEVYIRMTRGQDALVIDAMEAAQAAHIDTDDRIDFSGLNLIVLPAEPEALVLHEAVLADLDKASGNKTVWRSLLA